MELKEYDELKESDIWTTDGMQIQFHAMMGKEGFPVENRPEDANIFVFKYSIPDSFFD